MQALFGTTDASASSAVVLSAPDIAENGRVVPVSVSSTLDGVESISIIVEQNPSPLAASFDLGPGAVADVSTRLKMGKTLQRDRGSESGRQALHRDKRGQGHDWRLRRLSRIKRNQSWLVVFESRPS